MSNLQPPEYYLEILRSTIKRHKEYWGTKCDYTSSWRLSLEKKTNRHTTTRGNRWGWYEICPIGIEVGFWSDDNGRDDLKDIDIKSWNAKAKLLEP